MAPKPKPVAQSVSPSTGPPDPGDAGSREGAALISAQFSGPLPLPSHLEHYERVLPGAADRIVRMGESEQAARHIAEKDAIQLETFKTRWGFVAWALTLAAVVSLAYLGHGVVAAILASGIGLSGIARLLRVIRGDGPSE